MFVSEDYEAELPRVQRAVAQKVQVLETRLSQMQQLQRQLQRCGKELDSARAHVSRVMSEYTPVIKPGVSPLHPAEVPPCLSRYEALAATVC